ncbi:MAG: pyruvate, water dikinase regulatory protein [Pseudomonadota bacterium]
MGWTTRTVFYVSDSTGITAQTLGHSLMSQFEAIELHAVVVSFVTGRAQAEACVARIRAAAETAAHRPLVFSTLVDKDIAAIIDQADALHMDLFRSFLTPLERELGMKSTHYVGRSHATVDTSQYIRRMDAVNYTLQHDDGQSHQHLDHAEVILVGVSRSGKTPTSLYLAMHYGIYAANYPLIPEDFERDALPGVLETHADRLVGLTIDPARLSSIRSERRPNSQYAALASCRAETVAAERLMSRHAIPWLDSTAKSIEELSAEIVQLRELDAPLL